MRVLQSNFTRFLLIVLSILAVTSPFWLFQGDERDENADSDFTVSEQISISSTQAEAPSYNAAQTKKAHKEISAANTTSQEQQSANLAHNNGDSGVPAGNNSARTSTSSKIVPIDESKHKTTGTIDLNHLPDVSAANLKTPKAPALTAAVKDEPDDHQQDPGHDQPNVSDLLSDKAALSVTQVDHAANSATTTNTANSTNAANSATTQTANATTAANTAITASATTVVDTTNADTNTANTAQAQDNVGAANKIASLSPASQVGDESQKYNAGATTVHALKAKEQTNTPHAPEPVEQKVNSLQQQVNNLVEKQGPLELAKYKEAQKERREQVNWAVDTIKANSKIYLPEYLSSRAVIVYFGVEVDPKLYDKNKHLDGITGPTKLAIAPKEIYTEHGKEYKARYKFGNSVHYLANMLHEESGATLFNIVTVERYPTKPTELYDYAFAQQVNNRRPELTDDQPLDLSQFDTIYLCYSIWWQDMPMPFYSFLDKYDLSGKTLIPICLSDKGGFYKTVEKITMAEPNANVRNQWLIHTTELENYEFRTTLRNWLIKLNSDLN